MSAFQGKTDRRMLPRWRASEKAAESPEFSSFKKIRQLKPLASEGLTRVLEDFSKQKNLGIAADVLANAVLGGDLDKAEEAATFILQQGENAPTSLRRLALQIQRPQSILPALESNGQTAKTRRLLKLHPDNPMLWSDMARHFASLGEKKRAFCCMQSALQLAPNHRWVVRTMARFMVHYGDPASAHHLIANHPRTKNDPWLIAAELACAQVASKAPKYWRQANEILKHNGFSPFHISELATATAMMELESGERKKAKRLVQKGLISPTENTLAQVFWAKENKHLSDGFKLAELVKSRSDAYEAEYQLSLFSGDFLDAIEFARIWGRDEPFAARPRAEIAFIASILDDYDLAIKMADEVKKMDGQTDSNLEMNRIYSILSSGKLNLEANSREIEKLRNALERYSKTGGTDAYHAEANLGLWHYRFGSVDSGKQLYAHAIELAEKLRLRDSAAMAATFAAREAILSEDPEALFILEKAKILSKKADLKASNFYLKKLDRLYANPAAAKEILTPLSASLYLNPKKPQAPPRITKDKDGFVIWLPKNHSPR